MKLVTGDFSPEHLKEMKRSLKILKESNDTYVEFINLVAKQTRHKFEALVAEGFSEEQALDLIKAGTPF